jgi:hypothetical protein
MVFCFESVEIWQTRGLILRRSPASINSDSSGDRLASKFHTPLPSIHDPFVEKAHLLVWTTLMLTALDQDLSLF